MYEFKIGDEVEVVRDTVVQKGRKFIVDEIIFEPGDIEPMLCGTNSGGWFPSSLKLVCPAGYRPVREDEMDEVPRNGDAWLEKDSLWVVSTPFASTFGSYIADDGEPWFRPLTTEPVKAEPTVEASPVVKEDNNWGWMCKGATALLGRGMSESFAKSAAQEYSRRENRDILVLKVMGEYSTTCTTKWTPTDE